MCVLGNGVANKYHNAGPCRIWWPLNHTDIHLLPVSASLAEHEIKTEVIITCAALQFQEVRFESLVHFPDDNGDRLQRAGLLIKIADVSFPLPSRVPSLFRISPDWNPRVPLMIPYDFEHTQNTSVDKVIWISVCYTDGTCFSEFDKLVLHTINVAYPRWEEKDVPIQKTDDVLRNDAVAIQEQHSFDCESRFFAYVPPFVNSIANRDAIGQWLPVLLPPDLVADGISLAEIGVQRADFSLGTLLRSCGSICKHWLLVDLWDEQNLSSEEYIDSANERKEELAGNREIVQERARQLMKDTDITVTLMQNSSILAANELIQSREAVYWRKQALHDTRGSLHYHIDFVYLDARHDYASVVEDICAWFPLVTPGGILAGHDYIRSRLLYGTLFTVRQAVDKFTFDVGLELRTTNEVEDHFPTWFVYRPRILSALQRANFRRFCLHTQHL
jgi:hypothetical protein